MNTLSVAITHYVSTVRTRLVRNEEGAAMVEYGLLIALIAVTVMVTLTPLGNAVAGLFSDVTTGITGGGTTTS